MEPAFSHAGAAANCSNQADLHLTFTDPILAFWPAQRPSSTSVSLATSECWGFWSLRARPGQRPIASMRERAALLSYAVLDQAAPRGAWSGAPRAGPPRSTPI